MSIISNGRISFFITAEHPIVCVSVSVCVYHTFFIHFSMDGHLDCVHILAIVNDTTQNSMNV